MFLKKISSSKDLFPINDEDFDEFIYQPTPLSSYLKNKIKSLYLNENYFIKGEIFKKIMFQIKTLIYLKITHETTFEELKKIKNLINFEKNNFSIEELENLFLQTQKLLIKNNLSLIFFYTNNKSKIEANFFTAPLTFEELLRYFLKKLQSGQISVEKFKKSFGHYSKDNYELAARRFSEYSKTELMALSKIMTNLPLRITESSLEVTEQFAKNPLNNQEIYTNILVIRDFSKDISVKIISLLRQKILKFAKINNISNPFMWQWQDLVKEKNEI